MAAICAAEDHLIERVNSRFVPRATSCLLLTPKAGKWFGQVALLSRWFTPSPASTVLPVLRVAGVLLTA
jgi:hypothetical protein